MTGFLLPAKVLDASIADKKGAMMILTSHNQKPKVDENTEFSIEENNINELDESPVNENHLNLFDIFALFVGGTCLNMLLNSSVLDH